MSRRGLDRVAMILAIGVSVAVIVLIVGVMIQSLKHGLTENSLSENETQVLTAVFTGMFGVLGAYVGYQAGSNSPEPPPPEDGWPPPDEAPTATYPATK